MNISRKLFSKCDSGQMNQPSVARLNCEKRKTIIVAKMAISNEFETIERIYE